ncbi:Protein DCL, chloroplastic [Linum grandiflorum]
MTMASLSKPLPCLYGHTNPIHAFPYPVILQFSFHRTARVCCALKTESDESNLLSKSVNPTAKKLGSKQDQKYNSSREEERDEDEDEDEDEGEYVDWEERILEDTVPLVGFVRMILHSGKYEVGDRLSEDHQRIIADRVLPYHPEYEEKIGCGLDYIKLEYHRIHINSKCMFIVRKDGESIDFSYWKCIKGLIRKRYPQYAETFIRRHFGKQNRK